MKQQFLVNNIKKITNTPEFVENFLNQFGDCLEVKPRFGKCQEIIEVRIKSVTQQEDDTFIIEFATQEDSDLFLSNYQVNPIRMIFV